MKGSFKYTFLGLLMTILCCSKDKPTYTITDKQFIDILVDVHIAEAALQNYYNDEKDSLTEKLYTDVFALNNIDSTIFRENLKNLKRDPVKLKAIYTMVVEGLSVKESEGISAKKPKKK